MCDYQGYEFGAGRYPDSVCINGQLFDADDCDGDGNLYYPSQNIPCPMCEPKQAVEYWASYNSMRSDNPRIAKKRAKSLVMDIRKNRGVLTLTNPPAHSPETSEK